MKDRDDHDQATMDADHLYREETVTDRKVGMIRVLHPITAEGTPDNSRPTVFIGQASLHTPAGNLPLNFELPADNLAAAVAAFAGRADKAVEETMQKLEQLRREQASSLYIPGQDNKGGGIQMP